VSVAPAIATIYVGIPGGYEMPVTYFGNATTNMNQPLNPFSLSGAGLGLTKLAMNAGTGVISGTPSDNINAPGNYNITVNAKNQCGVSNSANLALTVLKNYACGDNIVNSPLKNYGEQCELPNSPHGGTGPNDQWDCDAACHWTGGYCGDGNKNLAHEACDTTGGNGTSNNDQYACTNCSWSGGWCGDATLQAAYGEQCDSANLNGQDCNSVDPTLAAGAVNAGKLACDAGCKFNTSACIPYCVFGGPIPCVIQ